MLRSVYFLLALVLTGVLYPASGPSPERARPPPPPPSVERFRGGQFQWTRLQTSGVYWNRHSNGDPALLNYLRRATVLKIDPVWHSVRATSVEALAIYPFIYCDNISYLSTSEAGNLAEYLRRGGFLFIDACENHEINPNIPRFLQDQLMVLRAQFPDLRLGELTPTHEIFSVYFTIKDGPLYRKGRNPQHPMYTVFDGDHLIGVIGLNGYQCGWSSTNSAVYASECAQMMTNIYVYALTR
jgi:Domain of unknown function (DUF4159)